MKVGFWGASPTKIKPEANIPKPTRHKGPGQAFYFHYSLADNGDFKYKGVRDEHGLFKGKAIIEFANGDTLHGFFVKGKVIEWIFNIMLIYMFH